MNKYAEDYNEESDEDYEDGVEEEEESDNSGSDEREKDYKNQLNDYNYEEENQSVNEQEIQKTKSKKLKLLKKPKSYFDDYAEEDSNEENEKDVINKTTERFNNYNKYNNNNKIDIEDNNNTNEDYDNLENDYQSEEELNLEEQYLTSNYAPLKEINISYNKLYNFSDYDVYEGKFGNQARIQFTNFDYDTYKPEEPIILTDEKGNLIEKLFSYNSFIRWSYEENNLNIKENGENIDNTEKDILDLFNIKELENKNIISNSRIVEWSDGSYQLLIGSDYYDININNASGIRYGINSDKNHCLLVGKNVNKKMIVKKSTYNENNKIRRESYTYEDIKQFKTLDENKNKVKTFSSYFNKNKFTREEYTAKPGKLMKIARRELMQQKKLESSLNKNNDDDNNNMNLTKKRKLNSLY